MSRLLSWFRRRWIRKDSQHPDRPTVAERLRIYKVRCPDPGWDDHPDLVRLFYPENFE